MGEASSSKQLWSVFTTLVLITLAYVGYTGIQSYSTTPKWIGLLSIGLILLYTHRNQAIKWSWGLTIWSIFVLQYLFQTTASYNTYDAIAHSLPLIIGPLLVLGLFRDQNNLNRLAQFSLITALITLPLLLYGLYELVELLFSSDYTRTSTYGVRFSFGHKNQLAQFFTLLIPIYALGIITAKEKWKQVLFMCSCVVIYVFVTLLINRTSLILLYGVYPLAALVYLIHVRFSNSQKRIAFGTLSGIVILGVILLFSIPDRIPFIGEWIHSESGSERLMIWQNSLELAKESPIFGHGSGNWKIEILRTSLERSGFENQLFFQRAHNEFIHTLVENGIVGMLVLLTFFVYSIVRVIRSSIEFNVKLFSITGLISFLIISSLSFPLERVELVFLLFVFLVPTYSLYKTPKPIVRYLSIGLAAICFIFAVSWIRQQRSFFVFRTDNAIDLALDLDIYTIDASSTPVAFYEGNYYFGRQNYAKAATSFQKAYEYNPYHVHVLNNLASSQSLIGQTDKAKETYKRLFELDSLFVEGLINAASVHFNSGDIPQALDYLLKIPKTKEPENFHLFATIILRGRLEMLKTTEQSNSNRTQGIDQILTSEDDLMHLFYSLRNGESLINILESL